MDGTVDIRQLIVTSFPEQTFVFLDPAETFDRCVVGVLGEKIVYDQDAVIQALVDLDGMSEFEAQEYFDYNIAGSYLGEHTPVFITNVAGLG